MVHPYLVEKTHHFFKRQKHELVKTPQRYGEIAYDSSILTDCPISLMEYQGFKIQIISIAYLNCMKKTGKTPPFQVQTYLPLGISKDQILQLKDAFDLLDPSATGTIDIVQLKNLVSEAKNLSLSIAVEQATKSNRPVDFSTFLQVFTVGVHAVKSRQTYRKVFRLFDDQNMGCITAKNVRRVIKQLQVSADQNQIQEMIERADINNDGVVSEQQFYQIMSRISSKI